MKITIHQPEHFPYLGFFQKMNSADLFVILDNVKFRKNYFQNRNKFLNTKGQEEWFGVSIPKKSNSLKINEVFVTCDSLNNWKSKVINKIMHNFNEDMTEIYSYEKLIDINMASINWCRDRLNIKTPIVYSSELKAEGTKSELLLDICLKTNASEYISGPSGKDYLDLNIFKQNNIEVSFFQPEVENYYSMLYNLLRKDKK